MNLIDFEDRSEEAQTAKVLREQAVGCIAIAVMEMEFATCLVRGAVSMANTDASRMISHREATRALKRIDDLLREAEDSDAAYVRSSAIILMLKNEAVGLRSKLRTGVP